MHIIFRYLITLIAATSIELYASSDEDSDGVLSRGLQALGISKAAAALPADDIYRDDRYEELYKKQEAFFKKSSRGVEAVKQLTEFKAALDSKKPLPTIQLDGISSRGRVVLLRSALETAHKAGVKDPKITYKFGNATCRFKYKEKEDQPGNFEVEGLKAYGKVYKDLFKLTQQQKQAFAEALLQNAKSKQPTGYQSIDEVTILLEAEIARRLPEKEDFYKVPVAFAISSWLEQAALADHAVDISLLFKVDGEDIRKSRWWKSKIAYGSYNPFQGTGDLDTQTNRRKQAVGNILNKAKIPTLKRFYKGSSEDEDEKDNG